MCLSFTSCVWPLYPNCFAIYGIHLFNRVFCLLLLFHSTLTILRHPNAFHSVSVSIENYNKFGKQRVVTANQSIKLARFFRGNFSRGGVAFTTGIISSSEITATQEIPFINPFQGIRTRSCLSIYFRS